MEVILIPSLSGRHQNSAMASMGLEKLKRAVKTKQTTYKSNPIVTYNSTSLGKLDEDFIREMYISCCPTLKIFGSEPKLRLVYPTKSYIVN